MKWEIDTPNMSLIEELKMECGITDLQAKLLINRGIKTVEDANLYLYGDLRDLYSPETLHDVDKAVDILEKAKKEKLNVMIAGDYDADGIDASVLTNLALEHVGIKCKYYIPHRIKEGYGLSMKAVDDAIKGKFDVIYTVDNGIAAKNEVKRAKELGLYVIVTDHHDIPKIPKEDCTKPEEELTEEDLIEDIPQADAVVNPKLKDCKHPNKKLCGCSISWKVLFHLYKRLGISVKYLYDLLPLVAIATVGDMMDLEGENRIFVKEGIKRINKNYNIGIKKLKEIYKLEEIKSEDLGFKIVPTLNADGRLEDAYKAANLLYGNKVPEIKTILDKLSSFLNLDLVSSDKFEYLIEDREKYTDLNDDYLKQEILKILPDFDISLPLKECFYKLRDIYIKRDQELNNLANTLYETNEKRKDLTKQYFEECVNLIKKDKLDEKNIIIVFHEEIPEGLVGLVAGKLKEKYHKPTFVFTNAEEYYKGSGRGVEGHPFSLFEGLHQTKGLWAKGGGHPMAAGVSFEKDINKLNEFRDRLDLYISALLKKSPFEPTLKLDAVINEPTEELCREIEIIQPTGKGNAPAAFGTDAIGLLEAKPVGDGTHIRFKTTSNIVGIAFSMTSLYNELGHPQKIKFAYAPNINIYSFENAIGEVITKRSVQMLVHDINSPFENTSINKNALISSIKSNIVKRK